MEYGKVQGCQPNVVADGALAVIAGSDTVSATLTSLFYLLLSHEEMYKRVQFEIDQVYPQGESTLGTDKHSKLTLLGACMYVILSSQPGEVV